MASLLPLLALLLLLASLSGYATAQSPPLVVEGRVFCDACGAGHFAKSSFYLAGARVGVQCGSGQVRGHVTAYAEGKTGIDGKFSIPVAGEHENDFCVALVLHSAHPTCNLISHQGAFAAVYLTRNAGLADNVIHTGPFSFTLNRPTRSCAFEVAAEEANISGGD